MVELLLSKGANIEASEMVGASTDLVKESIRCVHMCVTVGIHGFATGYFKELHRGSAHSPGEES